MAFSSASRAETAISGWTCTVCTSKNPIFCNSCGFCGTSGSKIVPRSPDSEVEVLKVVKSESRNYGRQASARRVLKGLDNISEEQDTKSSSWSCQICTLINPHDASECDACGESKSLRFNSPTKVEPETRTGPSASIKDKPKLSRRQSNDPRAPLKPGVQETYDDIISTCASFNEPFVDDSFTPTMKSLFINGQRPTTEDSHRSGIYVPEAWLRPKEICSDYERGEKWTVMNNPVPADICQGSLGDCWILGSLAVIAERKELLENIIKTKEINPWGAYIIRLNHFGTWKDVIVDDLLPCDSQLRLIYAKGKRKQLWVPLIEKALAKLNGSYEALIGGVFAESLSALTGFPCDSIYLNTRDFDRDLTWATLVSSAESGFLMGAGTHGNNSAVSEQLQSLGLRINHAYSILNVNGQWGHQLLKLRNPWGKGTWTGKWSKESTLWTTEMKNVLKPTDCVKGTFWMCFDDFVKYFSHLDICRIRKDWAYHSFQGIFVPYVDNTNHPCYVVEVNKPTELDITLYQSSWQRYASSKDNVPDVSLVFLKADANSPTGASGSAQHWKLIEFSDRVKKRQVNLNVMVDAGTYYVVPISAGQWVQKDDTLSFPEYQILMYSSRPITCTRVVPPRFMLADVIMKIGLKSCDRFDMKDTDVSVYSHRSNQPFGQGSLYMIENKNSKSWVMAEVDVQDSHNIIGTRTLLTVDLIPPRTRQIVNICTAINVSKEYKMSLSLKTVAMSGKKGTDLSKFGYPNVKNMPELSEENIGVHSSRPI